MYGYQISQVGVNATTKWLSRIGSSSLKKCQIASRYANTWHRFQFFNGKYHAIIEIVECESGQIAQKWSSAGRICGCRSIRSQPRNNTQNLTPLTGEANNL